ncbi:MAG TPA: hypothetical protein VJ949_05050, partial [Cryomorphaceae bacterium]|nr:hypothetical protein [Cryomorphaceae bacterium]
FIGETEKNITYVSYYHERLNQLCEDWSDLELFHRGLALAALHFGIHRMGMYLMAHAVAPYPFLPRVAKNYVEWMEKIDLGQ